MKFLLDTNVFSEMIKPTVNPAVMAKMEQNKLHVYVATTVWQELIYGLSLMADGRKKRAVAKYIYEGIAQFPVVSYDKKSASVHGKMRASSRSKGKIRPFVDSQIASVAIANDMILVTRNVKDFENIEGLKLENWFE